MKYSDAKNIIMLYEYSIQRPRHQRIVSPEGKLQIDASKSAVFEYARKCMDWLRFGMEVDACLSGNMKPHEVLKVSSESPEWMQIIGCRNLPIHHTQKHVKMEITPKVNCRSNSHGLDVAQIKALPELIEHPIAIIRNPVDKPGFVAILDAKDKDKLPLLIAIKPNGYIQDNKRNQSSNMLLSVYGKDNFANYFKRALAEKRVLFKDVRKIEKLLGSNTELQLRGSPRSLERSIDQTSCEGKNKDKKFGISDMFQNVQEALSSETLINERDEQEKILVEGVEIR